MSEINMISEEMRGMRDLDAVIATHLPNTRMDDAESVAQLQQLINIRYPDAQSLSIDGGFGPKTMVALQAWLGTTGFLPDLEEGARNTIINPDAARAEGRANGYIPFQDDMIANAVNETAKDIRGMTDIIDEVVNDVSMGGL